MFLHTLFTPLLWIYKCLASATSTAATIFTSSVSSTPTSTLTSTNSTSTQLLLLLLLLLQLLNAPPSSTSSPPPSKFPSVGRWSPGRAISMSAAHKDSLSSPLPPFRCNHKTSRQKGEIVCHHKYLVRFLVCAMCMKSLFPFISSVSSAWQRCRKPRYHGPKGGMVLSARQFCLAGWSKQVVHDGWECPGRQWGAVPRQSTYLWKH